MAFLLRDRHQLSPNEEVFAQIKVSEDHPQILQNLLYLFFGGFQPLFGSAIPLIHRRKLFEMGACDFIIRLLAKYPDNEGIHFWCWRILHDAVCILDNDDVAEYESIDLGVECGVVECIAKELAREPMRPRILSDVFSALTTMCIVPRHCQRMISAGIVELCLKLSETRGVSIELNTSTLGSLKNLAMTDIGVDYLKNSRAIEIALSKVHLLESEVAPELKLGICAASLIVRIVGPNEIGGEGSGMEFLVRNSLLFLKLRWLLQATLEVGPTGTVLDSGWNPANIVLDISILANIDENKFMLVDHVSLLAEALQKRGLGNPRLVKYSVQSLASLRQEKASDSIFMSLKRQLRNALEMLELHLCVDLKTFQDINMLLSTLDVHHHGDVF